MTCGRAPFLREGGFLKRGISWWKHSLKLELRGYFYESQFELRSIPMGVKWSYGNITANKCADNPTGDYSYYVAKASLGNN